MSDKEYSQEIVFDPPLTQVDKENHDYVHLEIKRISIGMDVRPFDATAAQVEGYFRGIAEAALKKGGRIL